MVWFFCIDLFGMPGYDLVFRVLRPSIIGAERFNGRVRDGIVLRALAMLTRQTKETLFVFLVFVLYMKTI